MWVLLTESARLDSWFVLPLMSALGAKKTQGFCLESSFCEGCVEIEGRGACLSNQPVVSVLQGYFPAASEILKHLKERFPPNSQHAQVEY